MKKEFTPAEAAHEKAKHDAATELANAEQNLRELGALARPYDYARAETAKAALEKLRRS